MKKTSISVFLAIMVSEVVAHGGKEGPHHEETTGVLSSTDPAALGFTLGISLLALVMLGLSVRKYRKDSN